MGRADWRRASTRRSRRLGGSSSPEWTPTTSRTPRGWSASWNTWMRIRPPTSSGRRCSFSAPRERHVESAGRPPPTRRSARARSGSLPLFHPTWFGRADWFRRHGYRTSARRCEDQELLFRARRTSRFANLPEPLLGYREDSLPLKSVLMGRASFAGAVARSAIRTGRVGEAVASIGGQASRGLLDLLAVSTRLESRLLQHRARPAPAEAVADWVRVWEQADRGSLESASSFGPAGRR